MRVLMPAGLASVKPLVNRTTGAVDYKMNIWNPCPQDEPQIALLTPSIPTPAMGESVFAPQSFRVRFPFLEDRQKKSIDLFQTKPPSFLDLRRRK
jgi:hypothetical protein